MKSVNIQTKLDENNPQLKRQKSKESFSNIFFQLGPRFNRINQVKDAERLYNSLCLRKASSLQSNKPLNSNTRIVNEMNGIYHKITQSYHVNANKHESCLDSLHEKYNQIISLVHSPQGKFFSTEIKRRELSGHYANIYQQSYDWEKREASNECDLNNDKKTTGCNRKVLRLKENDKKVFRYNRDGYFKRRNNRGLRDCSEHSLLLAQENKRDDLMMYEMRARILFSKKFKF